MITAAFEIHIGPNHKLARQVGGENITSTGKIGYPCSDVDANATDVVAALLDLARVNAGANLEVDTGKVISYRRSAGDGIAWRVKCRHKSIASRMGKATIVALDLSA